MWEKFGEIETAAAINELAGNMKAEGDKNGVKALAEERGIDNVVAGLYLDGTLEVLCTDETAALGKLDIEKKDLNLKRPSIMDDWVDYIKTLCMTDNTEFACGVMKKEKTLKECIGRILKWSFANQNDVDRSILKAAGVTAGRVTMGIPGAGQAKKIIRNYYLGGSEK